MPVRIVAGMPGNLVPVPNNFQNAGGIESWSGKMNDTIKTPALDNIGFSLKKIERITAEGSA